MKCAGAVCAALAIVAACTPIRPVPLSSAPVNSCPCDAYDATKSTIAPRCESGRCEVSTAGNRPEVPFWIVISVPTTSGYAPGLAYVLYSDEKGSPTFTRKAVGALGNCLAPLCVLLGGVTATDGAYTVAADVSLAARYPLDDGAAIPVRVEYEPVQNNANEPLFPALPLEPTIVSPALDTTTVGNASVVRADFSAGMATGVYQRTMYPQPPFDALFPPRTDPNELVGTPGSARSSFTDDFLLDGKSLDPADGRKVTVKRDEGLDGWTVSIVDQLSGRRISTLKTLSGTSVKVELDTTGQQAPNGSGLPDDVEVVVAPPSSFVAVPTFVTPVFGGQLFEIDYPVISPPVPVQGVVAEPTAGDAGRELLGYQAHITFESSTITTPRAAQPSSPLLQYTTNLDTDDHGRFSTVLPPGTYTVTTEPAEGTGYAKSRSIVNVDANKTQTALTLQPPPQTKVTGHAFLTDGRPLADADILAIPQTPAIASTPKPRPGRSHTQNDGSYQILLDEGPYALTFIPKVGSGFPRVVTTTSIGADTAELPDVMVPPPTPLSFTVRDPTTTSQFVVANAVVRIFTIPGVTTGSDVKDAVAAGKVPVEIGEAMTDANGQVEILLAPSPR